MKSNKKSLLMIASLICGLASLIINEASKSNEVDEAAEKAAEIVMKKMQTNNDDK